MEQLAWIRVTTGQLWGYHGPIETRIPFHPLASSLSFFLPFFFSFLKESDIVTYYLHEKRGDSSPRLGSILVLLSLRCLSNHRWILHPTGNVAKERNCNPGPRIHGLPVSSLMLCSTADTLYRAYANIFALNDASNPRRAAPLTRINFWTKGIPRENIRIRGRYSRFERIWIRLVWIRRLNLFNHYHISKLFWFSRILDILE